MSETIIVASKLPYDLIIRLQDTFYTLNGCLKSRDKIDQVHFSYAPETIGTTKIPKDFWDAWVAKHQEFIPYKKGFIFAQKKISKVIDEGKDKASLKTGLERMDKEAGKKEDGKQ